MRKLIGLLSVCLLTVGLHPVVSAAPVNNSGEAHHEQSVTEVQQSLPGAEVVQPTPTPIPIQEQPQVETTPVATVALAEPVQVTQPVYVPGCEQYVSLISQYDWNISVALQVAMAESSCNTLAVGDKHIPPVSCGLFQVRTLPGRPSCEQLQDPATNVAFAYQLYVKNGWQPWSVCRTKVSCY
jgi:hypothetical protein